MKVDDAWAWDPAHDAPKQRTAADRVFAALPAVIAFLLALTFVAAGLSRTRYGTLEFWGLPERIDYCGRRYYQSSRDVRGTPEVFTAQTLGDREWKTVGRTITFRPIQGAARDPRGPGSVCTVILYIPTGDGRYRSYALSGGP